MLLFAGLGNPGLKFAKHRHNVGFMAVDKIIDRHNFAQSQNKFKSHVFDGRIGGEKTVIIKPQTFMNLSGEAVGEAMRFFKLDPGDIYIFHDELDLAAGKIRIKTGGGDGGHRGLKSIDGHCGKDYQRIRIGIDHPGHKARVNSHVLGDFSKSDYDWLNPLLVAIADYIECLVKGDQAELINKIMLATGGVNPDGNLKSKKQFNATRENIMVTPEMFTNKPQNLNKPSGPMADMLKKLLKGNKP